MNPTPLTVAQLKSRLAALHARIGFEGRFTLTIEQDRQAACRIVHWVRPGPYAAERWTVVGTGSAAECLEALERYTRSYRRRTSDDAPVPALAAE